MDVIRFRVCVEWSSSAAAAAVAIAAVDVADPHPASR